MQQIIIRGVADPAFDRDRIVYEDLVSEYTSRAIGNVGLPSLKM
jgi:hypothetical protein